MKHTLLKAWHQRLADWLAPAHRSDTPPPSDASDWAHASAVGEEDPGASVDLLDTRPSRPDAVRADGPPRR